MRHEFSRYTAVDLRVQRNLLAGAVGLLLVANAFLSMKTFFSEDAFILIPQFDTDVKMRLTASAKPEMYYSRWADGVIRTLLCVNPDSVAWKTSQILEISSASYGSMRSVLDKELQKIKENQMSTVFYPKDFRVNVGEKWVKVSGQYFAFFGRDKDPVIQDKTYRVSWVENGVGLILLAGFEEEGSAV